MAPKPPADKPTVSQQPNADADSRPRPRPTLQKQESTARQSGNHSSTHLMNTTINTITERQKEFRAAAVEAKRAGEIETAKEYLKIYKGLDNLLKVAQGGLPVDLNTVCLALYTIQSENERKIYFSFPLLHHKGPI